MVPIPILLDWLYVYKYPALKNVGEDCNQSTIGKLSRLFSVNYLARNYTKMDLDDCSNRWHETVYNWFV